MAAGYQRDVGRTDQSATEEVEARSLTRDDVRALFQRHNDELVHYLTGRLKSREEAVEVAQEAYVRLLRLDDTSTIGFLRAFLYRTATNIAIDRARQRSRAQAWYEDEAPARADEVFSFTPERQVAARQSVQRVVDCLNELPEKCRHAFVQFKFRNRDYDDIAAEMGLTASMVRKYVLRALVHCTEVLGDELDAWGTR
ncbi:MAG: RNA polymerase sigma factor [Alphaproteobacteria bacterium]|nr:MAG: RNA polymerase sigma factor [Alphaproteobacteria bacterium]